MGSFKSIFLALFIVLSGTLLCITYEDYLLGNYEIGDQVEKIIFSTQSPWETVYCQDPEQVHLLTYTSNASAYDSDFIPMQDVGDYVPFPSNPNLWYININEAFIIEGLDSWVHFILKSNGYNRRRFVVKLIQVYNVDSDGSLGFDYFDYIKHVEDDDVQCTHIFGD